MEKIDKTCGKVYCVLYCDRYACSSIQ